MGDNGKRSLADNVINFVLLAVLAYAVLMPGSVVRKSFAEWSSERALTKNLRTHWPEIESTSARLGPADGVSSALVKFSDYQCRYCRLAHSEILAMVDGASDLAVGVLHFPVAAIHPYAIDAALVSICGEFQGRFSEIHEELFGIEDWGQEPDWLAIGASAGVNSEAFQSCLKGDRARRRLERDMEIASELGVRGTPTFVTQSSLQAGYLSEDQLRSLVQGTN